MKKITVYIYSVAQIPTLGFVDKEGALHACAQAGNLPFDVMKHYPSSMNGNLISPEEKNTITSVETFCRKNGYQFEIVDFARLSFLSKIKLKRKGVKSFPTVSYGEKFLCSVPTEDDLNMLVKV